MVKIEIDDNYGLKTDEFNIMLCKLEGEGEEIYFRPFRYYRTFKQALEGYMNVKILGGDEEINEFSQLVENMNEAKRIVAGIAKQIGSCENEKN